MPESNKATTRPPVGLRSRRIPEVTSSQTGMLQAQSAEGWCSHREILQTQTPNEATNGLAPSVSDSFSGAVKASFRQRMRRT